MKWYKKQLDQLKKSSKSETEEPVKTTHPKPKQSFGAKKIIANKNSFSNPVAARNRNRPKTDSI